MPSRAASMGAHERAAQEIAYDLWCIQEDRLRAGAPLVGLGMLVSELHERHPDWDDTLIEQGVSVFLNEQLHSRQKSVTQRQRLLFQLTVLASGACPAPRSYKRMGTR
ncbi:MAG: hypothetical protein IPK63_23080 [Candidatus Competibacteraceae bacterium]|nr:hypothetical protein [Candidatus Competibacteraceae bacterium]